MKNLKTQSKIALAGLVCLLLLSLSSCIKDHNTYITPPTAGLMVIQGSPDAPAESFYLNSNRVTVQPFTYGEYINYINAYAGHRTATLYNYSSMASIASDTINLKANTNYSLFLANTYTKPDFILLTDTITQPSAGNASIRLVNVSPGSGSVDLVANGNKLVSNKSYKGSSSFLSVPGNTSYNFSIRQNGTTTVLAKLDSVNIKSGFIYTIWLHGLASGSGTSQLTAGIITNGFFY